MSILFLQSYKPLLISPTAETWAFLHLFFRQKTHFLPIIALFSLENVTRRRNKQTKKWNCRPVLF